VKLLAKAILLLFVLVAVPVKAAEITTVDGRIRIDGEIQKGDLSKLMMQFIGLEDVKRLFINSKGGDLKAALDIADFVRRNHIGVAVAERGYCASSCFFIFIAGYDRMAMGANDDGSLPKRIPDSPMGFVGVHRPYYAEATAPKKQEEMMENVKQRLSKDKVPQYLIEIMMSRPSNDIYWLSDRDLEMIGEFNPGDEEVLIRACGYKRVNMLVREGASRDEARRIYSCERQYWERVYRPEQKATRDGMRDWVRSVVSKAK